jgi:hypothetical protein
LSVHAQNGKTSGNPMPRSTKMLASAAALLFIALCAAYVPDIGHGFILDDFRWIRETRVESVSDLRRLVWRTDGFYRPLVSATFTVNSWLFGLEPIGYGATNFILLVADAALLFVLARRLGLAPAASLLAAAVWTFNFHGINMAVLWVSGRTALVLTFGALLTAIAVASGRMFVAAGGCLVALFSKEEAVVLPTLFTVWLAYDASGGVAHRIRIALHRTWPLWAAFALYIAARLQTAAFWPSTAPPYYHLTAAAFAPNALEYADRSMTCATAVALVLLVVARPSLDLVERRIIVFAGIWLVCGYVLTVFIPARSSLYAVLPTVGPALGAAAVASAALRKDPQRIGRALTALAVLPLLLVPVYRARNERWVRLAEFSSSAIVTVQKAQSHAPDRRIVLVDDPAERFNLDATFGDLWPDAAALFIAPDARIAITTEPAIDGDGLELRLDNGRLVPTR